MHTKYVFMRKRHVHLGSSFHTQSTYTTRSTPFCVINVYMLCYSHIHFACYSGIAILRIKFARGPRYLVKHNVETQAWSHTGDLYVHLLSFHFRFHWLHFHYQSKQGQVCEDSYSWWRHIETFPVLFAFHKGPVMLSVGVFFVVNMNK